MAWPSNVVTGGGILASQYNALVTALQTWGGAVSAAGNTLSNLGGLAFTGSPAITFPGVVTFSVAPVFTDQAGSRTALGLGSAAVASAGNLTEATSAVLTITGGTGGVLGNVSLQVKQASASQNGYLSSTDWSTFNSKQAALTLPLSIANGGTGQTTAAAARTALGLGTAAVGNVGNLTEATSAVLTITGGTGAVIGSVSVQVKQATTSQSGYLSNTDWNTFNAKQAALTLPLSIANGGTGQATAAAALTALGGASLTANNTFSGNQVCPQITSNNYFTGTSANVFWLQSVGTGVFFNTWNGVNWFQTANITASSGLWTFQQAVTFSNPASITFGSNWQSYTPTFTPNGSMTISGLVINDAQYLLVGPIVFLKIQATLTLGGTAGAVIKISYPVPPVGFASLLAGVIAMGGTPNYNPALVNIWLTNGFIQFQLFNAATMTLGAATLYCYGSYRAA